MVLIDYDLEKYHLQLKTNSKKSSDIVAVDICTEDGTKITDIRMWLGTNKYTVGSCLPAWPDHVRMSNVPNEVDRLWKITKSSTSLIITCNDVEVVKLVYDAVDKTTYPDCKTKMEQKVMKIWFSKWDSATDLYLPCPGNI